MSVAVPQYPLSFWLVRILRISGCSTIDLCALSTLIPFGNNPYLSNSTTASLKIGIASSSVVVWFNLALNSIRYCPRSGIVLW
jgi:hypothetical protein